MTGPDLLVDAVTRGVPGSVVRVDPGPDGGYTVTVRADRLNPLGRADREAVVYSAMARVPLSLLARVRAIDTGC